MESIGKAARIDLPRKFAPAKHQTRKPTLKHFASIWTLMDYPNGSASGEWPMEKKVALSERPQPFRLWLILLNSG
jgi:hypothetical protein